MMMMTMMARPRIQSGETTTFDATAEANNDGRRWELD